MTEAQSNSSAPARVVRIGVMVTPRIDLHSLHFIIDAPPDLGSGRVLVPTVHKIGDSGSKQGVYALALFLVIAARFQRSVTAMPPHPIRMLEGGVNTPASTLVSALQQRGGQMQGWHRELFNHDEKLFQTLVGKSGAIRPKYPGRENVFSVEASRMIPSIEVFQQEPSQSNLAEMKQRIRTGKALGFGVEELPSADLKALAREIVRSVQSRKSPLTNAKRDWDAFDVDALTVWSVEDKRLKTSIREQQRPIPAPLETWTRIMNEENEFISIPLFFHGFSRTDSIFVSPDLKVISPKKDRTSAECISPEELIKRISRFGLIIGEPGSGKSSIVKYLAKTLACKGDIALVIRLRDYVDDIREERISILEHFLCRYCRVEKDNLKESVYQIKGYLNGMEFESRTLILDGWDEVPFDCRRRVRDAIKIEKQRFRLIVTSRPSGAIIRMLEDADLAVEIAPLTSVSQALLAEKICKEIGKENRYNDVKEEIHEVSDSYDLGSSPFLLTLVTLALVGGSRLCEQIESEADLLDNVLSSLLIRECDEEYDQMLTAGDFGSLERLAFIQTFSGVGVKLSFRESDLLDACEKNGSDPRAMIRTRLLSRDCFSVDRYSFVHPLIQSALAARHLANLEAEEIRRCIEDSNYLSRYQLEIALLACLIRENLSKSAVLVSCLNEMCADPDFSGMVYYNIAGILARSGGIRGSEMFAVWRDIRSKVWDFKVYESAWMCDSGLCKKKVAVIDPDFAAGKLDATIDDDLGIIVGNWLNIVLPKIPEHLRVKYDLDKRAEVHDSLWVSDGRSKDNISESDLDIVEKDDKYLGDKPISTNNDLCCSMRVRFYIGAGENERFMADGDGILCDFEMLLPHEIFWAIEGDDATSAVSIFYNSWSDFCSGKADLMVFSDFESPVTANLEECHDDILLYGSLNFAFNVIKRFFNRDVLFDGEELVSKALDPRIGDLARFFCLYMMIDPWGCYDMADLSRKITPLLENESSLVFRGAAMVVECSDNIHALSQYSSRIQECVFPGSEFLSHRRFYWTLETLKYDWDYFLIFLKGLIDNPVETSLVHLVVDSICDNYRSSRSCFVHFISDIEKLTLEAVNTQDAQNSTYSLFVISFGLLTFFEGSSKRCIADWIFASAEYHIIKKFYDSEFGHWNGFYSAFSEDPDYSCKALELFIRWRVKYGADMVESSDISGAAYNVARLDPARLLLVLKSSYSDGGTGFVILEEHLSSLTENLGYMIWRDKIITNDGVLYA